MESKYENLLLESAYEHYLKTGETHFEYLAKSGDDLSQGVEAVKNLADRGFVTSPIKDGFNLFANGPFIRFDLTEKGLLFAKDNPQMNLLKPYSFAFKAVPTPENTDCSDVAEALVHIWVISDDKEKAKTKALSLISSYLWDATSIEIDLEVPPEQLPGLRADEAKLYNKALQHGIAATFLALPKAECAHDELPCPRVIEYA